MKHLACGLAALALLPLNSSAMIRLGETAELFFTGTLGARADDNIFLSDLDEVDDTILELTPGLKLVFGQGAKTSGSLEVSESFTRRARKPAAPSKSLNPSPATSTTTRSTTNSSPPFSRPATTTPN